MTEALKLELSLDQTSVLPQRKNRCNLVMELSASPIDLEGDRPPLSMVFVLDRSSSMKGPPIEHVAQSVDRIVDLLGERDRIGIVTFSTTATVDLPLTEATTENKKRVRAIVHALQPGKETNLEAGLRLAGEMILPGDVGRRRAVFVLSDGVPNVGRCTPLTLGEVVRPWRKQASVWSLGYGPHHQEDVLGALSDAGGGRYQFIPDPQVCEYMFAKAVGVQGAIVAEAVEIHVAPAQGAKVIRFLGKHDVRGTESGFVLLLPDFVADMKRLIVAEIELHPAEERGLWNAVVAELSYRPPGQRTKTMRAFSPVMVASTSSQIIPQAKAGVLLARCDQAREEARAHAERNRLKEARDVLESARAEILDWPGFVADDGSPLAVAAEIIRDEMMAYAVGNDLDAHRAYKRAHLGAAVSTESLSRSWRSSENSYADHAVRVIAGEYPPAVLEQTVGVEAGRVIRLRAEQKIGRSHEVEIEVGSEKVSRVHAAIFAQRGRFFVIDLGSANGTWVNKKKVQTRELVHGDIISVATDVTFVFREQTEDRRLIVVGPSGEPYVVEGDRLFVIGSSSACSLVLQGDRVARRHAVVREENGRWLLEVYAGANPVDRRGRTFESLEIEDGDEIRVGDVLLRFELR
jgi:Ca-activated chloride channel homolog